MLRPNLIRFQVRSQTIGRIECRPDTPFPSDDVREKRQRARFIDDCGSSKDRGLKPQKLAPMNQVFCSFYGVFIDNRRPAKIGTQLGSSSMEVPSNAMARTVPCRHQFLLLPGGS